MYWAYLWFFFRITFSPLTNVTIQLRKATIKDAQQLARIYNQYLGIATLHLDPVSEKYYQNIISSLQTREEVWVAEQEDKIIGWSIVKYYSPKEGYHYSCETSTFFDRNYLGKGYGKQLKTHILNRAKGLGYKYVVARIMSQNKTSIHFNLSLGYRIVGEQKGIGWVHGEVKDVTIMEKHL
jgi:phosphinothricin acetyltransferase